MGALLNKTQNSVVLQALVNGLAAMMPHPDCKHSFFLFWLFAHMPMIHYIP